ncbi:Decarboxylase family protein [Roseibacterium elongatum DSM 19469]|uniref:AMP nucleosidase n=1 Tax=Roseicyclus elongatus DSM 19469 TaxID=1294273 RepID=W8RZL9_9RHOB|nr:LOG family protein [Roseibacterium elongatum]AHM03322.1 Decarboxylase family protein [Roseibacterium elongatum DSM 19469]
MEDDSRYAPFRQAQDDVESSRHLPDTPQARSPAYRLAFDDFDFINRDELRPVRLQLELMKPTLLMDEHGIVSTVVLFGGARIPRPEAAETARTDTLRDLTRFYDEARYFARAVTERSVATGCKEMVVVTGGGPGVMEAGNRGAADAGGCSIGLNIVLPHEQVPNEFVTPELCFNFHYFGIRKMHFLLRAKAIAVFPGGFGTLDELFESLTLIQTGRMEQVPVLLFGEEFWRKIVNWDALAEAGTISADDLALFHFVESAEAALAIIDGWEYTGKRGEIPGR